MTRDMNNTHPALSLSTLPDDVLNLIIEAIESPESYLKQECRDAKSVQALQNLHLTSRKFYFLASRRFIPSFTLSCQERSTQRLTEILRHPIVGHGIVVVRVLLDSYSRTLADSFRAFLGFAVDLLRSMIDCKWPEFQFGRRPAKTTQRLELEEALFVLGQWHQLSWDYDREDIRFADVKSNLERAHALYKLNAGIIRSHSQKAKMCSLVLTAMKQNPRIKTLRFIEMCMSIKPWHSYPQDLWRTYYRHLTDPRPSRSIRDLTPFVGVWPQRQPDNYELLHMIPRSLRNARDEWGFPLELHSLTVEVSRVPALTGDQCSDITTALRGLRLKRFTFRIDNPGQTWNLPIVYWDTQPNGPPSSRDYLGKGYLPACLSPHISTLREVDLGVSWAHVSCWVPSCHFSEDQLEDFAGRMSRTRAEFLRAFAVPKSNSTKDTTAISLENGKRPNLKTIRLQGASFSMEDLRSFLRSTPTKLDSLVMDQPMLGKSGTAWTHDSNAGRGTWEAVLDHIRASKTFNHTGEEGRVGFRLKYPEIPTDPDSGEIIYPPEDRQRIFGDEKPAFSQNLDRSPIVREEQYNGPMTHAEEYVNRCGKSVDVNPVRALREKQEAEKAEHPAMPGEV